MSEAETWRPCSACKKPIEYGAEHWVCNVSTCNRKRTGLVFCSVSCWEVHLPSAHHRESWAVEALAPSRAAAEAAGAEASKAEKPQGRRRIVREPAPAPSGSEAPREILIVGTRLKDYVRARSGMNTSDRVLGPLSDIVRDVCEQAIENARRDGRKTVLDRDVPKKP